MSYILDKIIQEMKILTQMISDLENGVQIDLTKIGDEIRKICKIIQQLCVIILLFHLSNILNHKRF